MRTDNNPKKTSHDGASKNEDPVIFKILEGNMRASDYASLCLLVPEAVVEELAEALRKARSGQFVWTIGEDEITDIQNIPAQIAHPIRSIGEIPSDKTDESELLDWLIHGESYFSKKYVVLSFHSGCRKNRVEVYEITKKEHLQKFTVAVNTISNKSHEEYIQIVNWYVINRGTYLLKFHDEVACKVVDDDLVECFERRVKEKKFWWV